MSLIKPYVFFAVLFLTACFSYDNFDQMATTEGKGLAPFIKPVELANWIKEKKNIVLLDTREPNEAKISTIKNAVCVGYTNFTMASVINYPTSSTIVCYCSVGKRSKKIGEKLMKHGFKKVYNLYGGIFNWVNSGYQIVGPAGEKTNKVHAYKASWGKWLTKGEKVYS